MSKYVVGLYGLPRQIIKSNSVELEMPEPVSLTDLIASLRRAIPGLEGPVIQMGQDKLTENYAFNINGLFYANSDIILIRPDDTVGLLALAMGG